MASLITSVANSKVKLVRSLARRRARHAARRFVVEGVRTLSEVVGAGIAPALVFYTDAVEQDPQARTLLDRLRSVTADVLAVSDPVMASMSNTETPAGILAVLPFVELPLPPQLQFVLILDAVRDPGNVGTILRSAWAVGVDVVLFAPLTVDPFGDKVVRAAMGAHFHVPVRVLPSWQALADMVNGFERIYLADAHGELEYTHANWARPVSLIIGGEAEGPSDAAKNLATARVSIPMRGGAESLNAAMAATVLLFHAQP